MAAKQEPSLGLNYGWALGEDGWNTGMDANLVKLGCVVQLVALGVVNTPAVTTNGTVYLVGTSPTGDFAGQANKVAFRVEGAWVFYTPLSGWIAMVGGVPFRYNGTAWATQKATSQQAIDGTDDTLFITPAALKSALNAVGAGSTGLTNATNLNNVVTNTPFAWTTGATNTPVASSSGRGVTIATSATDATQYAFINATGDLWVRFLTSGTWGAWIAVSVAATSSVAIEGTDNTYKITPAALKAVLDAKGQGSASLTDTANLNTALINAPFTWNNTSLNTPVAASYGRGVTIASSATDATQIGYINATGAMYVRYLSGGAWGAWIDLILVKAQPFCLMSNPGTTPFPAAAYTPIPFFSSGEQTGITVASNTNITMPTAGVYLFDIEVRINGGAANMPPVGTIIELTLNDGTLPTALRAGFSVSEVVKATSVIRLQCVERITAGAIRKVYLRNAGAAAYQVISAVLKVSRLSA